MVMADKHPLGIRNGRRSRGPSPISSENSDGDDSDQEKGIRIGEEYQAEIPTCNPGQKYDDGATDAMLVWAPTIDLPEAKVDEYISVAKDKHGYNTEQALGMLFWHKHNVDRALTDLANFTPFPDEWSTEDKVLFEQAYNFHGKQFPRIRQMLPDKSIPSLVKFFYSWKKNRQRTSLMDRHARKRAFQEEGGEGPESGAASDHSGEDIEMKDVVEQDVCINCGLKTSQLHVTSVGSQCSSCYQYWRRTGVMRSAGPKRHESIQARHNPIKYKNRPPKGMHLDSTDLHTLVIGSSAETEAVLKSLDADVITLKRQVQNNKQMLSLQKHKVSHGVEDFRPAELPHKINSRWSNEELLLAVQGVRKYGKDFKAIADMIGNKLEAHVRSFFINFRRRYNLDEVLAEYETEHGAQVISDDNDGPLATPATGSTATDAKDKEVKVEGSQSEHSEPGLAPPSSQGLPQTNGTSGTPHLVPPPLVKQPPPPTPWSASATPTTTPSRLLTPQKTILQQPPPLRPSPATAPPAGKVPVPVGAKDSHE